MQGRIPLIIGLEIGIRTFFNQVESHVVVAERRCYMQRSHTVHEGLHEALFLDIFVVFVACLTLFFFLDKFAII